MISIYIKHDQNKMKTLTDGPNDATRVVWARFPRRNLIVVFLVLIIAIKTSYVISICKKTRIIIIINL